MIYIFIFSLHFTYTNQSQNWTSLIFLDIISILKCSCRCSYFHKMKVDKGFCSSTSFVWHNRPPLAATSLVFVFCSLMNNQEINSKRSRVTASGTYQFSLLVPFYCLIFRTQSMWFWMKCFDLVHILYYQLSDSMKS